MCVEMLLCGLFGLCCTILFTLGFCPFAGDDLRDETTRSGWTRFACGPILDGVMWINGVSQAQTG